MPIGNISKSGDNFTLAAAYDLAQGPYRKECGKKKPEVLHKSNIFSQIYSEIGEECNYVAAVRKKVKKPVLKLSINFDKDDGHTAEERLDFTRNTLESLGVTDDLYQYMITAHHDKPHPHHHILVNRIKLDGSVWSDSFSKAVLEVAIDKAEKKMLWDNSLATRRRFVYSGLNEKGYEFQSANGGEHLPKGTVNVLRNKKKGVEEKVQYIQKAVADALNNHQFKDWDELREELSKSAIDLVIRRDREGSVTGTSFRYSNLSAKGTKIDYRAGKIQKILDKNKLGLAITADPPIKLIDHGKSSRLDGAHEIIRKTVDHCLRYCYSMESFSEELQSFKIEVRYKLNKEGKAIGTSYRFKNYEGSGSEINLPSPELYRKLDSNQAKDFSRKQNSMFQFKEKHLRHNLAQIQIFGHIPDESVKIRYMAPRKPKTAQTRLRERNIGNKYIVRYGYMLDKGVFGKITEQLAAKKFKSTSELESFVRESGFAFVGGVLPSLTKNGRSYSSEKLSGEAARIEKRQAFFAGLDSGCRNLSEAQLDEFFQNLPLADRDNVLKDGRVSVYCGATNENFYAGSNVVAAVERVIIRRAYQVLENGSVTDQVQLQKALSEKNITTNGSFPNEIVYNGHRISTRFSEGFSRRYNEFSARLKYARIISMDAVQSLETLEQEFATEGLSLDIDKKEVTFRGLSHKISEALEKFVGRLQRKEFSEDAEKAFETNKNCRSIRDLTKKMDSAGISISLIDRKLILKNQKFSIYASPRCVEIYNSAVRNNRIDAIVSKAEDCTNLLSDTITRDDFAKSLEGSGIYMNEAKTQLLLEKGGEEIPVGPKVWSLLLKIKKREGAQSIISQADEIAQNLTDPTVNSFTSKLAEAGIALRIEGSALYLSKGGHTANAGFKAISKWTLINSLERIKNVVENPDIEFSELNYSLRILNVYIDSMNRVLQYQSEKGIMTLDKSLTEKYFTAEDNSSKSFVSQCDGLISRYSHVASLEKFMEDIEGDGLGLRIDGEDLLISDKNWQLKATGDLKEFLQKLANPEPEILQESMPEIAEEPGLEAAPENSEAGDGLEVGSEPFDEDFLELQEKIRNIYDQSGSAGGFIRNLRDSGISAKKIYNDILFSYNYRDFILSELFSGHLEGGIYNYCKNGLSQGLVR